MTGLMATTRSRVSPGRRGVGIASGRVLYSRHRAGVCVVHSRLVAARQLP
jgi:hypothetical protein